MGMAIERVLVASGGDKAGGLLQELLRLAGFPAGAFAGSGSDARRLLLEGGFDLVVVNAPLPDELGHELAMMAAEEGAGVILAVKADIADDVSQKVEDAGVFVLEKPLSRQVFFQSIKLMAAAQRRIALLRTENEKLRRRLEELRLVDRAKCLLIQHQGLSESEAHRLIEKQAMDRRLSRREIAWEIIERFGFEKTEN